VVLARRIAFRDGKRKRFLAREEAVSTLPALLDAFHADLLEDARARREANSHRGVSEVGELREILQSGGGLVYTGWSGDLEVEERVKQATKATIRVIPDDEFASSSRPSRCIGGGAAKMEVAWARAY
jgi:prolyl-tRNA synthetase